MGKVLASFILAAVLVLPGWGMGGRPPELTPQTSNFFLIDSFENFSWWKFDQVSAEVINNFDQEHPHALLISGESKGNWYAGGIGCYIAKPGQDLSLYNGIQLDIYGFGPQMGNLKIELYDDDDGNWEIAQSTRESYTPICDDRFVKDVIVDWTGWKTVKIPFADFVDDNPGVGDDRWNPTQLWGSGGLLQLQFICISSKKTGKIQYLFDNIKLVKD